MTETLQDRKALQSIMPGDFAAFLRSHNWKQVEQIADRATVWTKSSDTEEDYEVVVPLRRLTSEYARRVAEALETLSVVEGQAVSQLMHDISTTNADILRVRLQHPSIDNGSIPIELGVKLVSEVRDAMLAAACAAVNPRALFQARKPGEATKYIDGLKMGQTEAGSFVLAIESNVAPALRHESLFEEYQPITESDPFERRVMLLLQDALSALNAAVVTSGGTADAKPFQDAVPKGVSANLCEALVGLSMDGTAEEVSFQFSWAPVRPVSGARSEVLRFGRDAFPVLREAARVLREEIPQEEFSLIGTVIALRREEQNYERTHNGSRLS